MVFDAFPDWLGLSEQSENEKIYLDDGSVSVGAEGLFWRGNNM